MANGINIRTAVIFWFITVGYMCAIFYLSSLTFALPELPANSDKIIHIAIYIPLAFMFRLSLNRSGINKYLFTASFLAAGIYGVTDEAHQYFVPGRDSAVSDIVADFIGALLGSYSAGLFRI
ncbi:MAG: hypothetical protein C4526_11875 [Nitrospiraceae bacterium]|nr:MAG: hypothetical protein C4526_11875 [Nitrospiraceae bacterium]